MTLDRDMYRKIVAYICHLMMTLKVKPYLLTGVSPVMGVHLGDPTKTKEGLPQSTPSSRPSYC